MVVKGKRKGKPPTKAMLMGKKKAPPVKAIAKAVRQLQIKEARYKEYHAHDVSISETITDSADQVLDLANIGQGDSYANRDGRKIVASSLSIRALLSQHASATRTQVRVVVVLDKAGLGLDIGTYLQATTDVQSFRSVGANVGRYKVLMDKIYILDSTRRRDIQINKTFNFRNGLPIWYSGSSAANPTKNNLSFLLLSNENTNTPTLTGRSRLRFTP